MYTVVSRPKDGADIIIQTAVAALEVSAQPSAMDSDRMKHLDACAGRRTVLQDSPKGTRRMVWMLEWVALVPFDGDVTGRANGSAQSSMRPRSCAAGSASVDYEAEDARGWQFGFESLRQRIATSSGLDVARAWELRRYKKRDVRQAV